MAEKSLLRPAIILGLMSIIGCFALNMYWLLCQIPAAKAVNVMVAPGTFFRDTVGGRADDATDDANVFWLPLLTELRGSALPARYAVIRFIPSAR